MDGWIESRYAFRPESIFRLDLQEHVQWLPSWDGCLYGSVFVDFIFKLISRGGDLLLRK